MPSAANLLALVQDPEDAQFADALAMERAVEAARLDAWVTEAERARGACWSGLGPDRFIPASEQQLIERARERVKGLRAWEASPERTFLRAIHELFEIGALYPEDFDALRSAYSRGLSDNTASVLRILAPVNHSEARKALSALASVVEQKEAA